MAHGKNVGAGQCSGIVVDGCGLSQVFTDSSDYEGILNSQSGVMLVLTASVILLNGRLKQKVKAAEPSLLVKMIRLFFWWVFSLGIL